MRKNATTWDLMQPNVRPKHTVRSINSKDLVRYKTRSRRPQGKSGKVTVRLMSRGHLN